jgi:hypothetical protein
MGEIFLLVEGGESASRDMEEEFFSEFGQTKFGKQINLEYRH